MKPRDNPFRAARISTLRYRFSGEVSWPMLFHRLQGLGFRGALVGPEGSGKTTLLEEIQRRLNAAGFKTRLLSAVPGRANQTLAGLSCKDVFLLIDSAERLNWFEWQRLRWSARNSAGLVVTLHSPGLLPTLFECRTTPELLRLLVSQLLPPARENEVKSEDLTALFRKHQGNVRSALRELYDTFSAREALKPSCYRDVQLPVAVGSNHES